MCEADFGERTPVIVNALPLNFSVTSTVEALDVGRAGFFDCIGVASSAVVYSKAILARSWARGGPNPRLVLSPF